MKSFLQFINENLQYSEEEYNSTIDQILSDDPIEKMMGLQELDYLYQKEDREELFKLLAGRLGLGVESAGFLNYINDLGLISQEEYKKKIKEMRASGVKTEEFLRTQPIGIAMQSDAYQKLMQLGFQNGSSSTQLLNGTLVLEMPGKNRKLGIFKQGVIRRMLLPGERGIDSVVKKFPLPEDEMYVTALQWILDNIDFDSQIFLTKKASTAESASGQKKAETMEKIYREFAKLGLTRNEAVIVMGGREPWNLTDAKQIYSIVRKNVANGILPYLGYSMRDSNEVYDVLSKPGIKWIQIWSAGYLSVYLNSTRIWDNFDLTEHIGWMKSHDRYAYREVTVRFANEDQIDQYAPIFNNYQPVLGVYIKSVVDPQMNQ